MILPTIDWRVFDAYSESACECKCGFVFRTHTKLVLVQKQLVNIPRKPCPQCGSQINAVSVRNDPEFFKLD